jgi:uracil-DNA glycosylase family 4
MRYKLVKSIESEVPFDGTSYDHGDVACIFDRVVVEKVSDEKNKTYYCIDVEDTHNFVTAGGVVHNCRPPNNRKPTMAEMQACLPFLYQQIEIIQPQIIVALGNTALEGLTSYGSITKRCGKWENLEVNGTNIMLMPCFHPSALLRNPNWKEPAKKAMRAIKERISN